MSEEKKEKEEKKKVKGQSAKEVAEAMVANMAANMNDPDFYAKKAILEDKVRKKIVEERKLREQKQEKDSE
jgi:hypothetical protein